MTYSWGRIISTFLVVGVTGLLGASIENPISVPIGLYVTMGNDAGDGQNDIAEFSANLGTAGPTVYGVNGAPEYSSEEITDIELGKEYVMTLSSEFCTGNTVFLYAPPGYQIYLDGASVLTAEATGTAGSIPVNEEVVVVVLPKDNYGGGAGSDLGFALSSVHWSVGLGYLPNGKPVGELSIHEENLSASIYSPSLLKYSNSPVVGVYVHHNSGVLRQIVTPSLLVDIRDEYASPALDGYKIRFYNRADLENSSWSGSGLFTIHAADLNDYYYEYLIEKPANNQFQIRKSKGGYGQTYHVTYNATGPVWTLKRGAYNGASYNWDYVETRTRNGSGVVGTHLDVIEITDGTTTHFKEEKEYDVIGGEEEMRVSRPDPDGVRYTGLYYYYTNSSNKESYRRLESYLKPEGGWKKFEYDNDIFSFGLVKTTYEPWKSTQTHPSQASASSKVTSFYYVGDNQISGVGPAYYREYPTQILTKVGSTTLSKKTFSYNGVGSFNSKQILTTTKREYYSSGANDYLETIIKSYEPIQTPRNDFEGLLISITYPDNTRKSFYHEQSGSNWVEYSFNGVSNSVSGAIQMTRFDPTGGYPDRDVEDIYLIPKQSTMERVERDVAGNIVARATYVYRGTGSGTLTDSNFAEVSSSTFTYENGNRLATATNSKGQSVELGYVNGLLDYAVDETGVRTEYASYDNLGRPGTITKKGFSGISGYSHNDIVTTLTYDAMGHATDKVVSGSGESITESWEYDLGGRLREETKPDGTGIAYSWDVVDGYRGQLRTEYLLDNGASYTPLANFFVTKFYNDGRIDYQIGGRSSIGAPAADPHWNPIVDQEFDYSVTSLGEVATQFIGGSTTRKIETTRDWLGRVTKEVTPNHTNSSGDITTTYEYIGDNQVGAGQLLKISTPGQNDTRFTYYEIGALKQSYLDLDGNNALTLNQDRILERDATFFEEVSSDWWAITKYRTYHRENNSTSKLITSSRETRLTYSGGVVFETKYKGLNGVLEQTSKVTSTSNGANKPLTLTTELTEYANSAKDSGTLINGLLWRSALSTGAFTVYGYDGLGRLTEADQTDNDGSVNAAEGLDNRSVWTKYIYDSTKARLTEVKTRDDSGTEISLEKYFYANTGLIDYTQNALSKRTYFDYTYGGELEKIWGDVPNPVRYEYSVFGELLKMHTFGGTSSVWSSSSWPGSESNIQTVSWNYDVPSGLLNSKVDGKSKTTAYLYNAQNQLIRRTHPEGNYTTYSYYSKDGSMNEIQYFQSGGAADPTTTNINYNYNRLGNISSVVDAIGSRTHYYDLTHGQLITETLGSYYTGDSVTIRHQYDSSYRYQGYYVQKGGDTELSNYFYYRADNGTLDRAVIDGYTFTYNMRPNGLVRKIDGPHDIDRVHNYDNYRNLLKSISAHLGTASASPFHKSEYVHDLLGRRSKELMTGQSYANYPEDGLLKTFSYTDRNELEQFITYYSGDLNTGGKVTVPGRTFTYGYDNAGNRISYSRDTSHTTIGPALNQANEITTRFPDTSIHTEGFVNYDESTSAPSRPIQVFVGETAGSTKDAATMNGGHFYHRYETSSTSAANNAITLYAGLAGAGAGGADLLISENRNAASRNDTELVNFDDNGNPTQDSLWNFIYDGENRIYRMWSATVNNGVSIQFTYDYMGRRVGKQVWNASNTFTGAPAKTRKYVYEGWNLVMETNGSSIVRKFGWGLDLNGGYQTAGGVGGMLWMEIAGQGRYYPTYDGNGNVTSLLKESLGVFTVEAVYEYGPYGELIRESESSTLAAHDPIRFSTKMVDRESGLHYFGYRFYAPEFGRFLNRDPLGEAGGSNLYRFAGNDPINNWDYLGLTLQTLMLDMGPGLSSQNYYSGDSTLPQSEITVEDLMRGEYGKHYQIFEQSEGPIQTLDPFVVYANVGTSSSNKGSTSGIQTLDTFEVIEWITPSTGHLYVNNFAPWQNSYTVDGFRSDQFAWGGNVADDYLIDEMSHEADMYSQVAKDFRSGYWDDLVEDNFAAIEKGVGAPGFWEGLIPVWGSGRAAVNDFQNGRWGWGIVNSAIAVTDVFLVKAAATAVVKGAGKLGAIGTAKLGVIFTAKKGGAKAAGEIAPGLARRLKWGHNWMKADITKAITRHLGDGGEITTWVTKSNKRIYENAKTGRQIVEDLDGGYFRIFQPNKIGGKNGKYLDMMGNVIPNSRQELSHFIIY